MRIACLLCLLIAVAPTTALAEGSSELGTTQGLEASTFLFAEVDDPSNEQVCWIGLGTATVTDPLGAPVGVLVSGGCATPTVGLAGDYRIALSTTQSVGSSWDISVRVTGTPIPGRVWSPFWQFDANSFAEPASTNGSFYALVGGGGPGMDSVVELRLDGLAGNIFGIGANETGVDGPSAGQSVPQTGNTFAPGLRLYVNPPDLATYSRLAPVITGFGFDGGAGPVSCGSIVPGVSTGRFTFTSNVDGTYQVVCDLNDDGTFDIVSNDDVLLLGRAGVGANSVTWDGRDNGGNPVATGTYDCRIRLNIGEFHYVGVDMETSYEGMRMFEVDSAGSRTGLSMFWNDSQIQSAAVLMPNSELGLESSGPNGIPSGSYVAAPIPNVNARSWGNFNISGSSKGNNAFVDTFTWVDSDVSTTFSVDAVNGTTDTDGEGLPDFVEECIVGSDPTLSDTDGDFIDDDVESDGGVRVDTDGDGTADVRDTDSDNDGIDDEDEGDFDFDGDSTGNWRDTDSDNDTIDDADEGGTADTDADSNPDFLDTDDDGDGILTADEAADDLTGGDDLDGDSIPSYRDLDSDGDTIPDADEGRGDVDLDGVPNYLDLDADGDGIMDAVEGDADPDGDSTPSYLDTDADGDTIPDSVELAGDSDSDGTPDYLDLDSDEDGVADMTEAGADPTMPTDTDSNGTADFRDPDDDGDGIDTAVEVADEATHGDPDSDGIPAYLDLDSDDDGQSDMVEGVVDPNGNGIPAYLDPSESLLDTDGDGLPDTTECPVGTTPCPDTDMDGNPDFDDPDDDGDSIPTMDERPGATDVDTDSDGTPDYLDDDDDGDTVPTADERPGDVDVDTDTDGSADHLDTDDDGDGIDTEIEQTDGETHGHDVDGDGIVNRLDTDSDNDGISDGDEGRVDTDMDGIPAYLDPEEAPVDTDGDGIPDEIECPAGVESCDDTDMDGMPNHMDTDDDGDGILTQDERPAGTDRDTDDDGTADHLDPDDDGDGVLTRDERPGDTDRDTDGDGDADHLDTDDDGDGLLTSDERPMGTDRDTDQNGTSDYLDPDDDGDGIPTLTERTDSATLGMDVDMDGDPNWRDTDADGDGIADGDEPTDADGSGIVDYLEPQGTVVTPEGIGIAGGAGCSAAPGSSSSGFGWMFLFVGFALLLRRRRTGVILALLLALAVPATASAQGGVTLNQYRPAETLLDGFAVSRPDDLGHLRFGAQLHIDYANDPLVLELMQGDADTEALAVVAHQLTMNLGLSLGLADRVVLYLNLPAHLAMEGDDDPMDLTPLTADGSGIGDVSLGARVRLIGEHEDTFALGLGLTATAPTAEAADEGQSLSGDDGFTLQPELLAELRIGGNRGWENGVRITANLGGRFRGDVELTNAEIGHELTWGLGVAIPIVEGGPVRLQPDVEYPDLGRPIGLDAHVEIHGATSLSEFGDREGSPIEALLGLKLHHENGFSAGLAIGPGLQRGYGSPDARGIFAIGWTAPPEPPPAPADDAPPAPGDRDRDGLNDDVDACPDEPEDPDGFEDEDGCPDSDNDRDGVADTDDACPLDPEDADTFEDDDGCPDLDNDADRILDDDDECPLEAEDFDSFEDGDGCPDTDNDQDTVLDVDDECPLTPGTPEANGCPRSVRMDVETGRIMILERVEFATNRDTILEQSESILDEVRATLAANPQLLRVRVEGHTDNRGREQYNLGLSTRRAASVQRWLADHGVAAERLEAWGCGEIAPIENNRTRQGRQNNRRVEFHIIDPAPAGGARSLEGCTQAE